VFSLYILSHLAAFLAGRRYGGKPLGLLSTLVHCFVKQFFSYQIYVFAGEGFSA